MNTEELLTIPEALPVDEWIVVFYPQTFTVRLHPSLHAAQAHLSKNSWPVHIYRSPADFRMRHDHFALERFWKGLYREVSRFPLPKYSIGPFSESDEEVPDLPTEAFCRELWNFMQRVGDRVIRLSTQHVRSKEHYEIKKADIITLMHDEETFKDSYPKQARIILDALARQDSPYILESDLMRLMNQLVANGKLRTKQDSWRIFQYYRPQFIDNGLLIRGDVGNNGDNDNDGDYEDQAA